MAENLALCYAEAEVGEDPVLGASMKQSEYSRRISFLGSFPRSFPPILNSVALL
jgi:hypothetical protein